MENLSDFWKKCIVAAFYIVGLLLCLNGITAIAGIPIAAFGYYLKRDLNV